MKKYQNKGFGCGPVPEPDLFRYGSGPTRGTLATQNENSFELVLRLENRLTFDFDPTAPFVRARHRNRRTGRAASVLRVSTYRHRGFSPTTLGRETNTAIIRTNGTGRPLDREIPLERLKLPCSSRAARGDGVARDFKRKIYTV